jgi:hypothetical protein
MSDYKFNLSGLGDSTLENIVRKSVENANYSTQELSDIQEPVQYGLFDSLLDQDIIKQSLADLQKAAFLKPNIVISGNNINLKTIIKKIFAKIFRLYIDSISETQSRFNHETLTIFCELFFLLKKQNNLIKQLQNELNELKNNV